MFDVGRFVDWVGPHCLLTVSAAVQLVVVQGVCLAVFVLVAVCAYVFCREANLCDWAQLTHLALTDYVL